MNTSPASPTASQAAATPEQPVVLRYPRYYTFIGLACLVGFGAGAILTRVVEKPAPLLATCIFIGFALLGAALMWSARRGTVTYSATGVRYLPLMPQAAVSFAWTDIVAADYNPSLQVIVLTLKTGYRVWVSPYRPNYQAFLAEAQQRSGIEMPVVVDPGETPGAFVGAEDEAMKAATTRARETLPNFLAAWRTPKPGEDGFSLKVRIVDGAAGEQVWLRDLQGTPAGKLTGVIDNELAQVRTFREGQRIAVEPEAILDWMYRREGRMVGNFSLRAMVPLLPPQQAREARQLLADAELG